MKQFISIVGFTCFSSGKHTSQYIPLVNNFARALKKSLKHKKIKYNASDYCECYIHSKNETGKYPKGTSRKSAQQRGDQTFKVKIFLFAQWEKIALRCTQAISETHFPLARLESQRTHIT